MANVRNLNKMGSCKICNNKCDNLVVWNTCCRCYTKQEPKNTTICKLCDKSYIKRNCAFCGDLIKKLQNYSYHRVIEGKIVCTIKCYPVLISMAAMDEKVLINCSNYVLGRELL